MNVTVVGGGIAGLAASALLAKEGHSVTVLERQPIVGGRAGLLEDAGFTFDTGPSWYLMPEVFDRFFAHFGSTAAQHYDLVNLDPGYRVFGACGAAFGAADDASDITVDVSPTNIKGIFEQLEPGAGAALDRYLRDANDTYDLAIDHFLYTNFASLAPFTNPTVLSHLPQLPRLFGRSLDAEVQGSFTHPLLRQILGFAAVFLGTSPQRAPALFRLMSRLDLIDGPQYPRGGMRQVITAIEDLALSLGVTIRTNTEVTALPARGRRIDRVVARVSENGSSHLEEFAADRVVAACDLHHLETHLLPSHLRATSAATWRRRDPGIGAVTVMLGLNEKVDELAHHNMIFSADWNTNFEQIFGSHPQLPDPASVYVCVPSRTDDTVAPAGQENLFVLIPAPADPTLHGTDAAVVAYVDGMLDAIGQRIGRPDLRSHIVTSHIDAPGDFTQKFHAWSGSALGPANTLLQSAFFRDGVRHPRVANLWRTGAFAAPGVGLPMCLISAENAVADMQGERR